jgi:surfactin synthase thioesterase subunit
LTPLQIIVSFRGTETRYIADILTDIRIAQVSLAGADAGIKLHRGFLNAARSAAQRVTELIGMAIPEGQAAQWEVTVTGHSLGAALAAVYAFELQAQLQGSGCDSALPV